MEATPFRLVLTRNMAMIPVLIPNLCAFHCCTGLGAELLGTNLLTTAIWHGLVLAISLYIQGAALRAAYSAWPALFYEPFFGCLVGRELADYLL